MGLLRSAGDSLLRWPRALGVALALVWIAGLHAGSFFERPLPAADAPPIADLLANWLHFPAYAALAVWLLCALRERAERERPLAPRTLGRAWFACALVGLSDELHQAAVPWRDGDPFDFCTDVLAAGGALWYLAGAAAGAREPRLALRLLATAAATLGTSALAARHSF
jgi:VanZ family protein